MPRTGSGVYNQPFPNVITNTTIESAVYNGFTRDVEQDLNLPRPIVAGGTGATSVAGARTNLKVEAAAQVVTNYDAHVFELGSFYSAAGATSAPSVNAFAGIVYGSDADNLVIYAHDLITDLVHQRKKTAGAWGTWVSPGGDAGGGGGTDLTGDLNVAKASPTVTLNDIPGSGINSIIGSKNGVAKWVLKLGDAAGNYVLSNPTNPVMEIKTQGTVDFYAGIQARAAPSNISVQSMARSGAAVVTNTFISNSGATWGSIDVQSSSMTVRQSSGGNVYLNSGGMNVWSANAGGAVAAIATAFKPGGGSWEASGSDARVKTVTGTYDSGLAQILQLQPKTYTYKGNDTSEAPRAVQAGKKPEVPYANSPHVLVAKQAKGYVGLIAQDVETVMPEMVTYRSGYIDGKSVNDLRSLDTTALTYALVNAVKELAARLAVLEAKPAAGAPVVDPKDLVEAIKLAFEK